MQLQDCVQVVVGTYFSTTTIANSYLVNQLKL